MNRPTCCFALALACASAIAEPRGPLVPSDGGVIDLPMLRDPALADPPYVVEVDPRVKPLWLAALERPEFDLRINAIEAFVEARGNGLKGIGDVPPLFERRLLGDENANVRISAARALAVFDHRASARAMLEASEEPKNLGADLILAVDPALARWDHGPAREVWIRRAGGADARPTAAVSAIRSLGRVGAVEATDALLALALDESRPGAVRLEAGRALGRIADSGLIDPATRLAGGSAMDRRIAAAMIAEHGGDAVVTLVRGLAEDGDPTVAAAGLARLNAIDPGVIRDMAAQWIANEDPNVRIEVVGAVAGGRTAESAALLVGRLGDPSVTIRALARDTLIDFDRDEALSPGVRAAVAEQLAGDDWRALEQAALIAGRLDLEDTAERLIELLLFDRSEVGLAAAAALRRLALPRTLPALLAHARERTNRVVEINSADEPQTGLVVKIGNETAQLFMLFAELDYREADPLLRRYIPKHFAYEQARAAAIYALGRFYEDDLQADLAEMFDERLGDMNPFDPEFPIVRRMSAVALGRMRAQGHLEVIEHYYDSGQMTADIRGSCRWALMRIRGDDLPPLSPITERVGGWFLRPARKQRPPAAAGGGH